MLIRGITLCLFTYSRSTLINILCGCAWQVIKPNIAQHNTCTHWKHTLYSHPQLPFLEIHVCVLCMHQCTEHNFYNNTDWRIQLELLATSFLHVSSVYRMQRSFVNTLIYLTNVCIFMCRSANFRNFTQPSLLRSLNGAHATNTFFHWNNTQSSLPPSAILVCHGFSYLQSIMVQTH